MNSLTCTASVRRITLAILVLVCAYAGSGAVHPISAAPLSPPARALVYVPETGDVARFEALGLPVYARLDGRDGPYLLVGAYPGAAAGAGTDATTGDLGRLAAVGLAGRVLDPDMTGATYYLAYPRPGRPIPLWRAYGKLLLDDGRAVLLRAAPRDAERLAADGAEIVLVTLTPKPLRPSAAAAFPPITAADPLVRSMIDQVSQTRLQQYVGDLSGEWPVVIDDSPPYTIVTRHTDSGTPIQKATQYVGEHLAGLRLPVEFHRWHQTKPPNVIAQITGEATPTQIFLIGAHLDDTSQYPYAPIAPGADDNASGSAAVLVAADILSQYRWGCTLRFAFWTGEEQGLLGSAAYAQRSFSQSENIAGVLNLDMIAWNTPGSTPDIDLHARSGVPGTVDLANLFAGVVATYDLDLVPQVIPNGATASDHYYFWTYGYPAILAIEDYLQPSGDFNPRYHKADDDDPPVKGDRLQYLDMDYFTDFVKASVGAFAHMSGCLLTGALEGGVTASHNGSAIAGTSIAMTDTHDLSYSAGTDDSGHYGRTLPAETYDITASAYGYVPATVTGVSLPTDGVTQSFILQAAPPVAPQVSISAAETPLRLTWTHVPPNMAYTVHRASEPYFTPATVTPLKTIDMPFTGPIIYDDLTGSGNRFYAVVGKNAAGVGAPADRVAVFNFALQPGE